MSQAVAEHRGASPTRLRLAVLTISDTRTVATDTSGALVVELAEAAGHEVLDRVILRDDPEPLRSLIESYRTRGQLDAVLLTGGTGISPRDQTFETISGILTKVLPGYGELFRMLSFAEIGSAAMLSRALGGLAGDLVILTMPGSTAAVRLAMTRLIVPELPHLVQQARKQ